MKDVLGKIPFRRIRNDSRHSLAGAQPFGNLDGYENVSSGAGSGQYTFLRGELLHHVETIMVADCNDLVRKRSIKRLGDKAGADTFDLVVAFRTAAENRSLGLNCHRQYMRLALPEIARHASERSTGAGTDYYSIHLPLQLIV